MKTALLIPLRLALGGAAFRVVAAPVPVAAPNGDITVAAYYFPNYHPTDPRNDQAHGKVWSEWEILKAARPRFPGHRQPKVPLWGYANRQLRLGQQPTGDR